MLWLSRGFLWIIYHQKIMLCEFGRLYRKNFFAAKIFMIIWRLKSIVKE